MTYLGKNGPKLAHYKEKKFFKILYSNNKFEHVAKFIRGILIFSTFLFDFKPNLAKSSCW